MNVNNARILNLSIVTVIHATSLVIRQLTAYPIQEVEMIHKTLHVITVTNRKILISFAEEIIPSLFFHRRRLI